MTRQTGDGRGQRLDSWKAIALYLDRDVRSVQRWEHERGLPVYRLPGQKSGAVFAYQGELDRWLRSRPPEASSAPDGTAADLVASSSAGSDRARERFLRMLGAALLVAIAVAAAFLATRQRRPEFVPAPVPPRVIAVLPMKDLSPTAAQDYFVDGFTEELVTELAQIRALRVISRTSTMIYKGSNKPLPAIARELHAGYVLEGSVAREGNHVRVIAQLIDAGTDTHVSARTYNADVKDVLAIQSQIARAIADDVRLDLSPAEKMRLAAVRAIDPAAHDLYLEASYAFAQQTPASIRQSLALYKAAAAKSPSFAMAYVGIAQAQSALLQITAEFPDEAIPREKEALAAALKLDPQLGEAHGLLASLAYWRDWDWPRAEREFRAALAEGAQAPTEQRFGIALITRGRFAEGTAHLQIALELDPLGKSPRVNQFFGFYFQRNYTEARRKLQEMLSADPGFLAGHVLTGLAAALQNDCGQTEIQAGWTRKHFPSPLADFVSALASACRKDFPAARASLEHAATSRTSPFASPYQLALGYAAIYDRETALSWLEKSASIREPQILYVKVEPMFDTLRSEPRFVALERRLGLLSSQL